ncbi:MULTISPECIES: P-aminobenzoate N-oxygenase AurF [unclassified Synechocystis]|uniref:P-aminobenzoate N-oxygenase AurF n=1 Tax=unclassified Synechocystis TaxID=2640012 RepID=UPI001CBB74C5|nr:MULTISPECIES: P-aminobenzoate N-oxygenase AurF [unclassified Synechocystis]
MSTTVNALHKSSNPPPSLLAKDSKTRKKLELNYRRAKQTDHSPALDQLAEQFDYQQCRSQYWQAPEFSLLYGTPLWDQASADQKLILNHLYWVAYYSQIIAAEVATIYFNQTSATGLYPLTDFRLVCDTLDLETSQERCHIQAFQTVIDQVEQILFGGHLFGQPRRSPFRETMIFANTNWFKNWWKGLQLQGFGLLSANNAFLACQYLTVRGLRTLNGKLVQHKLSHFYQQQEAERNSIPTQISYYHFLDESFHFNTSTILSHDVGRLLPAPTAFERQLVNLGIRGCQRDHYHVSAAINGIFWYDPALYGIIAKLLTSPLFSLSAQECEAMLWACFAQETEGLHLSFQTHQEAWLSYQAYLDPLTFVDQANKSMALMKGNSMERYLKLQCRALQSFFKQTLSPPPLPRQIKG